MADGASVGVISLDLVIKNKVQEQLDKISASIQNGFSKPVEQAEKAVENAMDKTAKAIDKGFEELEVQAFSGISGEERENFLKTFEKIYQNMEALEEKKHD